ncbi:unnamed protein product, partial [Mesorhabditis spiculigera]
MEQDAAALATAHALEFVHDTKWMSARLLRYLQRETKIQAEQIATGAAICVAAYLCVGPNARFICNALLTAVPILTTFVFPAERPESKKLFVYWAVFGCTTTLDDTLDKALPLEHKIQTILHILLFLRPFEFGKHLVEAIEKQSEAFRVDNPAEHDEAKSGATAVPKKRSRENDQSRASPPKGTDGSASADGGGSGAPDDAGGRALATQSRTDMTTGQGGITIPRGTMLDSGNHQLHSSASNSDDGIYTQGVGPENNLNDFITLPTNNLVFNGPFDSGITYHMKIHNNSHHPIAYAVKGNCLNRVTVYPPMGVLTAGQKILVGVKCLPFEYGNQDLSKDRFVFEYCIVPEETKKFNFKLLDDAASRRRKNIHVQYNP